MYISKKLVTLATIAVLGVGIFTGLVLSKGSVQSVLADNDQERVDEETLEGLYLAAFGRPVDDEGRRFHLGRNL
jgi:hypothetical protein